MKDILNKEFKTIDEQVYLLKEKGIVINCDKNASRELYNKNYYRLNGYMLHKKKNDSSGKFENLKFDEIINIYNFDSKLRNMLFFMLEHIEVNIKTKFAYLYSKKYGEYAYLEDEIFLDENKENIILKHYKKNYNNNVPIWVAVEFMTFGCLSKCISMLYKSSKKYGQFIKELSKECCGFRGNYFTNWLHGLVMLRNICAHSGRIFNCYKEDV